MFEQYQLPSSLGSYKQGDLYSDIYDDSSDHIEKFAILRETKGQGPKEKSAAFIDKENMRIAQNILNVGPQPGSGVLKSNMSLVNRRHTTNEFYCQKQEKLDLAPKQEQIKPSRSKSDANELFKGISRMASDCSTSSEQSQSLRDSNEAKTKESSKMPETRSQSSGKLVLLLICLVFFSGALLFIMKLNKVDVSPPSEEIKASTIQDDSYNVDIKLENPTQKTVKDESRPDERESKSSSDESVDYKIIATETYKMIHHLIELNDKVSEGKIISSISDKYGAKYFEAVWPHVLKLIENSRDILVIKDEESGETIWKFN